MSDPVPHNLDVNRALHQWVLPHGARVLGEPATLIQAPAYVGGEVNWQTKKLSALGWGWALRADTLLIVEHFDGDNHWTLPAWIWGRILVPRTEAWVTTAHAHLWWPETHETHVHAKFDSVLHRYRQMLKLKS